jgi:PleD family two-component response regulator
MKGESPNELYGRADALLYRSKAGGRNRVSV